MTLVSVTRFRLRSIRFVPFFILHANRTIAQVRGANGFIAWAVQRDADLAFWTVTVWREEHAMRAYGAGGAHRKAMPHLAEWADEASVGHWMQSGSDLPEWPEAVRRLREERPADAASPSYAEPSRATIRRTANDPWNAALTRGLELIWAR